MEPLKSVLKVGTVLGEGVRAYTIEKVTSESIYLRGRRDAQRGTLKNQQGALRIIPSMVISDILKGIISNSITLDDIIRRNSDDKTNNLFSTLSLDYDKFILGYDSTIHKICEFYLNNARNNTIISKEKILATSLPKPFLLLAGISGTGKTRFVREQAKVHNNGDLSNFSAF